MVHLFKCGSCCTSCIVNQDSYYSSVLFSLNQFLMSIFTRQPLIIWLWSYIPPRSTVHSKHTTIKNTEASMLLCQQKSDYPDDAQSALPKIINPLTQFNPFARISTSIFYSLPHDPWEGLHAFGPHCMCQCSSSAEGPEPELNNRC